MDMTGDGIDRPHRLWIGSMLDIFPPWLDATFISYDKDCNIYMDKLDTMRSSPEDRELAYAAILFDPSKIGFGAEVFRLAMDSPVIWNSGLNSTLGAAWRRCKAWFLCRNIPTSGMPNETETYQVDPDDPQVSESWIPFGTFYMWPRIGIYVSSFHDVYLPGYILSVDSLEDASVAMERIRARLEKAVKVCRATCDSERGILIPVGSLFQPEVGEGALGTPFGVHQVKPTQLGLPMISRNLSNIRQSQDKVRWEQWLNSKRKLWELAALDSSKILDYMEVAL